MWIYIMDVNSVQEWASVFSLTLKQGWDCYFEQYFRWEKEQPLFKSASEKLE